MEKINIAELLKDCPKGMELDGNEVQYEVVTDEVEWYSAKELNEFNEPNKEETIKKEKNDWAKWDLPDGYEFQDKEGNVINTDVIKLVKKQSLYPKTYEECCDVLNIDVSRTIEHSEDCPFYRDITCYEYDLLSRLAHLRKLIICRDAYWKIAGEQMGLGKPWEPNFKDDSDKYFICYVKDEVWKSNIRDCNRVLVFPTSEMRDAFYENFKDLIEQCKELL